MDVIKNGVNGGVNGGGGGGGLMEMLSKKSLIIDDNYSLRYEEDEDSEDSEDEDNQDNEDNEDCVDFNNVNNNSNLINKSDLSMAEEFYYEVISSFHSRDEVQHFFFVFSCVFMGFLRIFF